MLHFSPWFGQFLIDQKLFRRVQSPLNMNMPIEYNLWNDVGSSELCYSLYRVLLLDFMSNFNSDFQKRALNSWKCSLTVTVRTLWLFLYLYWCQDFIKSLCTCVTILKSMTLNPSGISISPDLPKRTLVRVVNTLKRHTAQIVMNPR